MRKIRFLIAMLIAKASGFLLKLLGRNASYLPGKIALAIDKKFLGGLTQPKTVIAVTGTNGKTSVTYMMKKILLVNVIVVKMRWVHHSASQSTTKLWKTTA